MSIIGISGKKQSGKNTIAKIINQLTNNKYEEKCFADKLKDIICLLIGCYRDQLEDEFFKSKELGEEWWYWYMERDGGYSPIILDYLTTTKKQLKNYEGLELIKPTPRFLLQFIGTNLFRNQLHPEIWVTSLFSNYIPISDISKSNKCTDDRLQHGYKGTKIWRTYHNIKQRCTNTKHPRYNDYGGRNIIMCKEWLNDINSFINWAIKNGYNESLTIDRIDNNKGYSPDNCRCVSYSVQSINTSLRKDNTSGYRGVTKDRHNWRAQIQIKGKQKFLGYFDTAEEASEAYEIAFMEREGLYLDEEKNNLIYPSWCITDMRFPNELEAVKKRGGITIRVNRPCNICGGSGYHKMSCPVSKSGEHYSEIALDKSKFDYIINNDLDIESLIEKIKKILMKEKLL